MPFENVIGHRVPKELMLALIKKGQIAGSYIFQGKSGIGKKFFALELAKTLLCQVARHQAQDMTACNLCSDCLQINKRFHPCVILVHVQAGAKNISIDEVRQMSERLRYKPVSGQYKIAIIDEAEKMTDEAMNSLLKTLEEPPPYGIIILTTDAIDSLFATIISRCRIIKFYALDFDQVKEYLVNAFPSVAVDEIEIASFLSDGSIGYAINLLNKFTLTGMEIKNFLNFIIHRIYRGTVDDVIDYYVKSFYKNREEVMLLTNIFVSFLREVLCSKLEQRPPMLKIIEETPLYQHFVKLDEEQITESISAILRSQEYLNYNVNPAIVLEDMFLSLREE